MGIGLMDHYIFNSLGPRNSKVPAGEETVIQEGNGCPRSQRSKWQSQHSNPGSLLPKSHLIFFPLLHKSLVAGVLISHAPLH